MLTIFREDARAGLTATPKSLPSKWFYDGTGNALFQRIAELTEARAVVELGLGSMDKTRLLPDALRSRGTLRSYVGVDVSESAIAAAGDAVSAENPGLAVRGVVADVDEHPGLPG